MRLLTQSDIRGSVPHETFMTHIRIFYMFAQLHAGIPGSVYHVLKTADGHDGFLIEQDLVGKHIDDFLTGSA